MLNHLKIINSKEKKIELSSDPKRKRLLIASYTSKIYFAPPKSLYDLKLLFNYLRKYK